MWPECYHYRSFRDAFRNFDNFNVIFIHSIFAQPLLCELNMACGHTTTIDINLAAVLDSICHLQGQVTIVSKKRISVRACITKYQLHFIKCKFFTSSHLFECHFFQGVTALLILLVALCALLYCFLPCCSPLSHLLLLLMPIF